MPPGLLCSKPRPLASDFTFPLCLCVPLSFLDDRKQALTARLHRIGSIGNGTPRHAQLLALILVPFVLVVALTASSAIKDIIESLVPNEGALAPLLFLVGMVLFIASLAITFLWVKTGGFRLFA